METYEIGQEVVRTDGGYTVGRRGKIIAIDSEKNRAQVAWYGETKTWVAFTSLALTSVPYEIIPTQYDTRGRRKVSAKYVRKQIIIKNTHMKTLFVTIQEFIASGGILEAGRAIYRKENRHFDSKKFDESEPLNSSLLLGIFIKKEDAQGSFVLKNNSSKTFVTETTGYVKIQATPIYK